MKNALLEIGVENLPARFVAPALKQLKENAAKLLAEQRLGFESVTAEGTYRRLALILEGLDDRSKDLEKEVSGPPASLLKDSNGDFTAQSAGFARSQGTSPDKLYVIKTAKGEFLCAKKIIKGSDAGKILSQIFPQLIASLQFPKNMIWESSKFKFARPIRWIVALCDGKIVPFKIADVKAGKKTTGLSAMGGKSITISKPQEYFSKLGQQCIVAEVEKRRKILKESVEKAARRLGYIPCADQELAEENLFLTENPIAVAGNFSVRFLKLPKELIKTVLKNQLKFFPLTDEKGNIQPHFIAVRDGVSENQKEVCSGYEAVVEARLSDAVFFFEKDLACPLDELNARLEAVLIHEDLGSMRKKADRVKKLAGQICAQIQGADKDAVCAIAAHVYSDLTSEAVREFPQLQGYMGGEYARHAKKPEIVCSGIKEFYYPLSAKSPLPGGLESAIVSLAGKIDTIIGDFAVGLIPSGSEDPHGLRRQALGAVRILLEKSIPLSLSKIAQESMELVKADVPGLDVNAEKICASALEFIWARAESIFEEKGFSFDEVRAVREVALVRQVPETLERISALHNARKDENFKSLTISFKRVANILRQAGFNAEQTSFNEELIRDDAERGLYAGFNVAKEKIEHYLAFNAGRIAQENFESAFKEMIALKPFVDKFFDEVMVMAEDPAIKNNRLSLLANLHKTFKLAADLSQLQ